VVGQGNHEAKVMFIGEAPGADEDASGVPFCGAAGKVLDRMFNRIGLKREDVYICNVIKCRPPNNREPSPKEKSACARFLIDQIDSVNPEVMITLGRHATLSVLELFGMEALNQSMGDMHGVPIELKSLNTLFPSKHMVPIYHPASTLHRGSMMQALESDFDGLRKLLDDYGITNGDKQ
jgi:DNA polymerase